MNPLRTSDPAQQEHLDAAICRFVLAHLPKLGGSDGYYENDGMWPYPMVKWELTTDKDGGPDDVVCLTRLDHADHTVEWQINLVNAEGECYFAHISNPLDIPIVLSGYYAVLKDCFGPEAY